MRPRQPASENGRTMSRDIRFAIYVYDDVEPIDLGATFGVLSMARRIAPGIQVFTVGREKVPVRLTNGLTILTEYGYADCPDPDILIVSGGPGWADQAETPDALAFVKRMAGRAVIVSVCTGAMILAAAGVLDGRRATTKRRVAFGETSPLRILRDGYPKVEVVESRLVDDGDIITGGGVTLAIDTTLYLLKRFLGESVADETARMMEYDTAWCANEKAFGTRNADETSVS